ncbi:MAG: pyridoxamine 5'-phosphate oxidase family protein [Beijerinckiaceae bacterium]|nr:pyridoxamine 5'-phosphate oxidase family protein [Beijerinckiaceae bacterium]
MRPSSDIAFSDAVKSVQTARRSRKIYQQVEEGGGFRTRITEDLVQFLAEVDTAYLATASADGQPYAQHRGGPPGFIRVIDESTLAFADYRGNRQYITTGNLQENARAFLFLMDYANRRRVKLWGTASVVDDDRALAAKLMPEGYRAHPEQVILFKVEAWDINCPQHIPQKFDAALVAEKLAELQGRLETLQVENDRLRIELASHQTGR